MVVRVFSLFVLAYCVSMPGNLSAHSPTKIPTQIIDDFRVTTIIFQDLCFRKLMRADERILKSTTNPQYLRLTDFATVSQKFKIDEHTNKRKFISSFLSKEDIDRFARKCIHLLKS